MFVNSVEGYEPVGINDILNKKVEAETKYFEYKNHIRAREIVLQKITKIESYLIKYREIMIANQAAIVEDIKFVDFPSDPFEQIMTPSEWREKQKTNNQK